MVVVSAEEWERKVRRKGSLVDFFSASPLPASGLGGPQYQSPPLRVRASSGRRGSDAPLRFARGFKNEPQPLFDQVLELAATQRRFRLGPAIDFCFDHRCAYQVRSLANCYRRGIMRCNVDRPTRGASCRASTERTDFWLRSAKIAIYWAPDSSFAAEESYRSSRLWRWKPGDRYTAQPRSLPSQGRRRRAGDRRGPKTDRVGRQQTQGGRAHDYAPLAKDLSRC